MANDVHRESHDMAQYVWTGADRYIISIIRDLVKSLLYYIHNGRKMQTSEQK